MSFPKVADAAHNMNVRAGFNTARFRLNLSGGGRESRTIASTNSVYVVCPPRARLPSGASASKPHGSPHFSSEIAARDRGQSPLVLRTNPV